MGPKDERVGQRPHSGAPKRMSRGLADVRLESNGQVSLYVGGAETFEAEEQLWEHFWFRDAVFEHNYCRDNRSSKNVVKDRDAVEMRNQKCCIDRIVTAA